MVFENKKNIPQLEKSKPVARPRRETVLGPLTQGKKIYTIDNFTITKLKERAKRTAKELDTLTENRHADEQLIAFGTPKSGEAENIKKITEQIVNKIKKIQQEAQEVLERQNALDQKLNDIGLPPDNELRLNLANKIAISEDFLKSVNERLERELDVHHHEGRQHAIREALRPIPPPEARAAQPVRTRSPIDTIKPLDYSQGVTVAEINAHDELRKKSGEITEEEEQSRIEAVEAEERAAEVSPTFSEAELQARRENPNTSRLTPTTSGERLVNVARSKKQFQGDFAPATAEEFLARRGAQAEEPAELAKELTPHADFYELGIELSNVSEKLATNGIRSIEELQQALASKGLLKKIQEIAPTVTDKNLLDLVGKKTLGFIGKPKFDKETAKNYFAKLSGLALERAAQTVDTREKIKSTGPTKIELTRTTSGENLVNVARSSQEFSQTAEGAEETAANLEWARQRNKAKEQTAEHAEREAVLDTVSDYIVSRTPLFVKRTSGEMNSGARALSLSENGIVLVEWKDPKTKMPASKYVKAAELVAWQKESNAAPATKNYEKPREMYLGASKYLSSLQERIATGQISTTEQLVAALEQMSDPSYRDLLSSQERFTTKISDSVSDVKKGLFKTTYTLNKARANEFISKLNQFALSRSETFRE